MQANALLAALAANLGKVILGQPTAIRWLAASFAAGGHVLLEDMPGTGKTTLANALARSIAAMSSDGSPARATRARRARLRWISRAGCTARTRCRRGAIIS